MATGRNNRNSWFNHNGENDRSFFAKHNALMRMFRSTHANVPMVNAPKYDKLAFLGKTRLLYASDIRGKVDESTRRVSANDWATYIPMWKVAQHRFPHN